MKRKRIRIGIITLVALLFALGAVNRAVSDFVGNERQFDDLTMLCVHYIGRTEQA